MLTVMEAPLFVSVVSEAGPMVLVPGPVFPFKGLSFDLCTAPLTIPFMFMNISLKSCCSSADI